MSNLVVVAIPAEDDPVWLISTEKVPNLTILFLGSSSTALSNQDKVLEFLEHASRVSLCQFGLDVAYRGVLGDDEADVVFFGGWELPELKTFRGYLLQEPNISKAHHAIEQHPDWLPHLTLGYPDKPAKKPKWPGERIYWVRFDRIALWTGDYEGPTFRLKNQDYMEVPMSTPDTVSMGTPVEEILKHHGVKGMRWGHRKDRSPTSVTVGTTKKGQIKTSGGKNQPAHQDSVAAKVAVQKGKKSGVQSLSNEELRALATRLELETKVSKLAGSSLHSNGKQFVNALLEAA